MESTSIRILTFKEAIREAQEQCLKDHYDCFLIGEGVGDPKNVFGTTRGLKEKFPERVFDMPISENGMTGVCIGASLNGMKPILVHMRMDFSLYSMDQIVNNAAKWFSMYGGQKSVPLVIRMIVGRGWGQGNQHSQNLTALYAHVPGLKIVCPSSAYDAKGLFIAAVRDPNPVLFIEHRWLYETTSHVPEKMYEVEIGSLKYGTVDGSGEEITVVASGHAVLETRKALEFLADQSSYADLIDLSTIKPLDIDVIKNSVKKTGRLMVVDDAWRFCGLAAEIIASVCEDQSIQLKSPPIRLTYPDYPSGSSPALTKRYYNGPADIFLAVQKSLGKSLDSRAVIEYQESRQHDVPDSNFRGPF